MPSSGDEDTVAEEATLLVALAAEMLQICKQVASPAGLRIRPSIGLASSCGARSPWGIDAPNPTQDNPPPRIHVCLCATL